MSEPVFGVGLVGFEEVGAHAGAEVLGLADVDDLAFGVLVEVAAGEGGDGADFCVEIHESAGKWPCLKFSRREGVVGGVGEIGKAGCGRGVRGVCRKRLRD